MEPMASRLPWLLFLGIALLPLSAQTQQKPSPSPPGTSSSVHHPRKSAPGRVAPLDLGSITNGLYRNPSFGFTCKIPQGWVLRTEDLNARESPPPPKEAEAKQADSNSAPERERVLLAVFSRPPEAKGEDVNSSVLIAAENIEAYPGLKESAQYFAPLTEIAKAQGFEVVNEPYEFVQDTKATVRGDFQKDVGTRMMWQSSLVILARGYAVSFTFIGGTEDEVEELIEGLSFGAAPRPSQH